MSDGRRKPGQGLMEGRFWGELQNNEYAPEIPRDIQLLAIGALINRDALDLAPMLLAPPKGPVK